MGLYRRACVYTQRERTGRRERGEEERENTHTTERETETDRQTERNTHIIHTPNQICTICKQNVFLSQLCTA